MGIALLSARSMEIYKQLCDVRDKHVARLKLTFYSGIITSDFELALLQAVRSVINF
jgi:hypothetical protein